MSVEKFIVTKEDSGYTIIPNNIIKFFHNNLELLGFWISLSSLPANWEFYKSKMMSDHNLGRDKLNRFLDILQKCNLISLSQVRKEDGTFGDNQLNVKSGRDFTPFTENQLTVKQPFTGLPLTDNQSLVTAAYKRNNKKETIKEKKEKSFCLEEQKKANAKKHDWANKPKSPLADVTNQSTSFKADEMSVNRDLDGQGYQAFRVKHGKLKKMRFVDECTHQLKTPIDLINTGLSSNMV